MSVKLFISAIIKFLFGVILVGALLFLPAWSLSWWQGWLFLGILFVPMFIAGIVMMIKNPELLKSRLNAKEKEMKQKVVILLSGLIFLASFIIAGLNYRYGWIIMPNWLSFVFAGVFLLSYLLYAFVLKQNTYLSRTIEVKEEQHVIDTGLYGVVRHPMYTATIFLFLSMPLVLCSIISFFIMLLYIPIIVVRLLNEEIILERDLVGYKEYKKKVKYRLIPYIW